MRWLRMLALASAVLVAAAPAAAQTQTGEIVGRVVDGSGAALPGTTVTATSPVQDENWSPAAGLVTRMTVSPNRRSNAQGLLPAQAASPVQLNEAVDHLGPGHQDRERRRPR